MTVQSTTRHRKTGWKWAAIVIVVVALVGPMLTRDRAGNIGLIARGKRRGVCVMSYQWLTDHEILYAEIWRTAKPHNRIVKRNVDTGIVSPIRAFESNQQNFGFGEMTSVLSPDKKTLIWIG